MVRIVGYEQQKNENGEEYFALNLHGTVEIVISQTSGLPYAKARKTRLVTTFDEGMCKSLVGTNLPGRIEKVKCDPFDYTVRETGEVIRLNYRYQYIREDVQTCMELDEESSGIRTLEEAEELLA